MLLSSDTPEGIAKSMGLGTIGFAQAYARSRPDILLVLGDRFEMHAAAVAALPFKIPLAHIHGGEITEGAIDDALRHSMTKLSHLHFVATHDYRQRVIQMGEEPWRVIVSGAPSLDNLHTVTGLDQGQLEERLGLALDPAPLLVTYHPVTLEYEDAQWQAQELLAALEECGLPVVFTMPNADTGGRAIRDMLGEYVATRPNARLFKNLGTPAYFSLMGCAAAMVGNSSSGIIEAPSFGLPMVNIGSRQAGRTRAANLIDVGYARADIVRGIRHALDPEFRAGLRGMANPYGDGHAAEVIVESLKEVSIDQRLIVKHFVDQSNALEQFNLQSQQFEPKPGHMDQIGKSPLEREDVEKATRALYHELHQAQGETPAIWDRLTALLTTDYLKVDEDWFVGKICLDAGCGSNANASYSMLKAGAERVHAFDLDESIFASVPGYLQGFEGRYELSVDNVFNLRYQDNFFDFTHCAGVLHSTGDVFGGLRELTRVTKEGGTLYVMLYGSGGLVREVESLLRDKYSRDPEFRAFVSDLNEQHFVEFYEWVTSEMETHGDLLGKMIPTSLLLEMFDKDLVLTIKDRIMTPLYLETSEEDVVNWLRANGFVSINRLTRYPRYKNIRRFLSPLYSSYDHKFARILYGSGAIQLTARKSSNGNEGAGESGG